MGVHPGSRCGGLRSSPRTKARRWIRRASVLSFALASWALASPASGQIIVMESLTAEAVQDGDGADELRLIVTSENVPDQEFTTSGTYRGPWNLQASAIFHRRATVRLVERDARRLRRERTQTLGEFTLDIAGGSISPRVIEAVFDRHGSRYVLRYRVE